MSYTDFIEQNIAPYLANKIGVYDSNGNRVGVIPLGNFKPSYGERLYRFGLLSDVHNQSDQSAESTEDLQRALEYFNSKESVWATCICGDISQNGTASEFQIYKNNVDVKSPSTPVYTTVGNHDATTSGLNTANWNTYTGHDRCFEITKNNDHFLFFGMNKWSLGNSGTPYLDIDIDWLEEKLEEYRNQRVFVFTHLFFPTRAGNLNNIYPSGNWLGGSQLTRIQALNDRYKNSIWFSGHSHWKWYLQKYQDRANIYKNDCGWCVHVPSCASPIDSNGTNRVSKPLESEGAIVDVYENYIDIRGMDLKNQKYLPIAQYRLDTTLVNIDAKPVATYTITNNLTDCTNSNTATSIEENSSYSANISANEGYTLSSVTITMGGTDITSSVYSNGVITIPNVTGNIVITATTVSALKPCTSVSLNTNTLTFTTNDAQTLTAITVPSDTTDSITWKSNNTSIVTINNGIVTPVGNGTTTIIVTCGSKTATCNITVSGLAITVNNYKSHVKISTSDGTESTSGDAIYYYAGDYLPIAPNTTYTLSCTGVGNQNSGIKICEYTADKAWIKAEANQWNLSETTTMTKEFSTSNTTGYIRIRLYMNMHVNDDEHVSLVMNSIKITKK